MSHTTKISVVTLLIVASLGILAGGSLEQSSPSAGPACLLAQRYPLTNRSADFYARSKTSNVSPAAKQGRSKH